MTACDTNSGQSTTSELTPIERANAELDLASSITSEALLLSLQGSPPEHSYVEAYETVVGGESDSFEESFVDGFIHARGSGDGSRAPRLKTDGEALSEEAFVRDFAASIADVQKQELAEAAAEAALTEAEAVFADSAAVVAKEGVLLAYFAQRYLIENKWKVLLMAAQESQSSAVQPLQYGWSMMLTQWGVGDPPDPDVYVSNTDALDRILNYGFMGSGFGATVGGGIGGWMTGGPGAFPGAALGGLGGFLVGATYGAITSSGGASNYQIALHNWCRDPGSEGHPDRSTLCD